MARPRKRCGFGNHGGGPRRAREGCGASDGAGPNGRAGDSEQRWAASLAQCERQRGTGGAPSDGQRGTGVVQGEQQHEAGFGQWVGEQGGFAHSGRERQGGARLGDRDNRRTETVAGSAEWYAASWEEAADSSTLREPLPSWALDSGTPAEHPSTQTLTPLGQSMALEQSMALGQSMALEQSMRSDSLKSLSPLMPLSVQTPLTRGHTVSSEFDELDDPFRGTAYRGIRQIGAGGMGQVFLVVHRELGCEFVAKLLRSELCSDLRTLDRVRIEAQSLGRLEHPHVVSVTDFGYSVHGAPFIVMEPLCGVTLAQRLKQGSVPLCEALVFVRETLSALAAAHAIGIVHRDIKPHNLFLHACEDGRIVLKVLDFGAARVMPGAPPGAPIPLSLPTQTGMVLGTPRFVSPEAAAGCPVDARGDLYAIGLVLYLLVAGRGPFDHVRTLSEVFNAHALLVPEPPSRYAREVLPDGLDEVVLKALSKRPEHRYQSAREFDAALVGVQRALALASRARARTHAAWGEPAESMSRSSRTLSHSQTPQRTQASQSRASQSRASQSRASQSRASQSRASQSRASQSQSRSSESALQLLQEPPPSVASVPVAARLLLRGERAVPSVQSGGLGGLGLGRPGRSVSGAPGTRWMQAPAFWAALCNTSSRTDRNAARPAHLSLRPVATVVLFVGTLVLTSVVGAGGATLLGRMVGSLP